MKKTWAAISAAMTVIGIIDYTIKLYSAMDFIREYILQILGLCGFTYLVVTGMIDYRARKRQQEYDRQTERRFLQFRQQYDGLFDANNQALRDNLLLSTFTDKEIDFLIREGYIKVQSFRVF